MASRGCCTFHKCAHKADTSRHVVGLSKSVNAVKVIVQHRGRLDRPAIL